MDQRLGFGILGTGNIAATFVEEVGSAQRAVTMAVGSRSLKRARQFASEHALPAGYGSYAEVLKDPRVDAVYIALPNSLHHRWALEAFQAGKHVLCEKPLAANRGEAQSMFEAATRANRWLVEAFAYRSHPQSVE